MGPNLTPTGPPKRWQSTVGHLLAQRQTPNRPNEDDCLYGSLRTIITTTCVCLSPSLLLLAFAVGSSSTTFGHIGEQGKGTDRREARTRAKLKTCNKQRNLLRENICPCTGISSSSLASLYIAQASCAETVDK